MFELLRTMYINSNLERNRKLIKYIADYLHCFTCFELKCNELISSNHFVKPQMYDRMSSDLL